MRRGLATASLDAAVRDHRVTVLQGLPCVGRTRLITRWAELRDDAEVLQRQPEGRDGAPICVLDHVRSSDIDTFVDHFRAAEAAKEEVHFVLVPVDLATTRRLHDALAGSVFILDLLPLQLEDFAADQQEVADPLGPSSGVVPEASSTNSSAYDPYVHWLRGGLPRSLDADGDLASFSWRRQMVDSLLVRDYSSWGLSASTRLADILQWTANLNGAEFDDASCPFATRAEVRSALYVFDQLRLTRRLPNFPEGTNQSLGRKPKLYIRDSGILHALVGVETFEQLEGFDHRGDSWESYAIENLIVATAGQVTPQFYRDKGIEGQMDEIDLVLDFRKRRGPLLAIECKASPNVPPRPGFHRGIKAIGATQGFVVHSGPTAIRGETDRLDLTTALQQVGQICSQVRSSIAA